PSKSKDRPAASSRRLTPTANPRELRNSCTVALRRSDCALARLYVLVGLPVETCLAGAGAEVVALALVIGAVLARRGVHRNAADRIDCLRLRSHFASWS